VAISLFINVYEEIIDPIVYVQADFLPEAHTLSVATIKTGTDKLLVSIEVPKYYVDLWYPNGFGSQPLYKIKVAVKASSAYGSFHTKWIEKTVGKIAFLLSRCVFCVCLR